jgi:hypothetical protein
MKYEYLKMEEEDVRNELHNHIQSFDSTFSKYYKMRDEKLKKEKQKEAPDTEKERPTEDAINQETPFDDVNDSILEDFPNTPKERKSNSIKKLYKKLSQVVHPDVSRGTSDDFLLLNESYQQNNLFELVLMANKYNVDHDITDADLDMFTSHIKHLEREIYRMKNTLAWAWGNGKEDLVYKVVESETGVKIPRGQPGNTNNNKESNTLLLKE